MIKHSILDDDLGQVNNQIIAIHTDIEDFRLCYAINKALGLNLSRTDHDLCFNDSPASFSWFIWHDEKQFCTWNLVANRFQMDAFIEDSGSLFDNQTPVTQLIYLIPNVEKVNYFLAIEEEGSVIDVPQLVTQLHDLPQVLTAYTVESKPIKSKINLIFS
jgi:hypothetical protein